MEKNIIRKIKPSPLAYLLFYFIGGIIAIGGLFLDRQYFLIGLVIILFSELLRRAYTYYITENGVEYKFSFVSKNIILVKYNKIQDLIVDQGLWDRILNIGTIKINTAGSPDIEIRLRGVSSPHAIEKIIKRKI